MIIITKIDIDIYNLLDIMEVKDRVQLFLDIFEELVTINDSAYGCDLIDKLHEILAKISEE